MPENLWPTDFGELPQKTPVAILREQARGLGDRTANLVEGLVHSRGEGADAFRHTLHLYSAPLGYEMPLLWIQHGIELYPVAIRLEGDPKSELYNAANPEEFAAQLKDLFAREKTKKTIASLIAQSQE